MPHGHGFPADFPKQLPGHRLAETLEALCYFYETAGPRNDCIIIVEVNRRVGRDNGQSIDGDTHLHRPLARVPQQGWLVVLAITGNVDDVPRGVESQICKMPPSIVNHVGNGGPSKAEQTRCAHDPSGDCRSIFQIADDDPVLGNGLFLIGRPLHDRDCDGAEISVSNRLDNLWMDQRLRQSLHLQPELAGIDTGRGIDRQNDGNIHSFCLRSDLPLRGNTDQHQHGRNHAKQKAIQMSGNSYDDGRLNLPFVGLCTFGKQPVTLDWDAIDADAAILGAPFDMGTQYRAGARFGPRSIREASTLFSFGHGGAYDHEDDVTYLPVDKVRLTDIGDADIIHTDTNKSHDNIEYGVRKILKAGAMPVVLGGDHSVHIPCIRAFDDQEPVHIVHIDAHLDFVDERHGVRYGHGNPLRRASEMNHVTGFTQLGIRNVSSSNRSDYDAARAAGSDILSVRQFRKLGPEGVLARVPEGRRYYLTIDIDGFDPSIAPGTGTPSHGGFLYYEILEFLQGLTTRGEIVGVDLVEVAPDYDRDGTTAFLAAQLLMNLLGFHFHAQGKSA